jgi:hypothetical protein
MEEHNLSPPTDREGLSQDTKFSPCYYPNGKNEWIAAVKNVYKKDGKVNTGHLQDKYPHLYEQGAWVSVIGIKPCLRRDLMQKRRGSVGYGIRKKSSRKYAACEIRICPSMHNTGGSPPLEPHRASQRLRVSPADPLGGNRSGETERFGEAAHSWRSTRLNR